MYIYRIIYLLIMKTSILVGGQAVIEGVMMRVPGAYSTALRLKNGEIISKRHNFKSIIEKRGLQKYVIIRGMFHLYESMGIGYQTLNWSAQQYEKDNNQTETNNSRMKIYLEFFMNFISIIIALSLFILFPLFITTFFLKNSINDPLYFNLVAGAIRITIFIIYLLLISKLNDVRRLFQYHGAEHKAVYNFESGKPLISQEAQKFSRKHPEKLLI